MDKIILISAQRWLLYLPRLVDRSPPRQHRHLQSLPTPLLLYYSIQTETVAISFQICREIKVRPTCHAHQYGNEAMQK